MVNGPRVTFWGAAQTVTGSMHLVEANGLRLLLDCGLYQGRRAESRERNATFPFRPRDIDALILSHAHIDHCGNIPNLFRQGFGGPIFCTPATRDLIAVMLTDSAKIQEEDVAYWNRRRRREGGPLLEPLYTARDVVRCMRVVQPVPYEKCFALTKEISFRFVEAGHLLGSAMVHLRVGEPGKTITFTGDLGRRSLPILRDPAVVPECDLLISESTYGGQRHEPVSEMADELVDIAQRTLNRHGKIIVPAFSLGRTQTMLFFLHRLFGQGKLRPFPIYVDSPLAAAATEVFRLHPECFDEETSLLLLDEPDMFGEKPVRFVRTVEESKALNASREPSLIIAASGMCESGRIVHHLKHTIEDERNTVLIIGFQAPETLGRRLVERRPEVRIHDRFLKLRAEVCIMNGFSSHADQQDFNDFLGPLAKSTRHVRLVHGEPPRAEALAQALVGLGFTDVVYPRRGESIILE